MWRHAISGARSTRGEGQAVVFSPSSSDTIHTNTIEGSFSIFKRGMKGIVGKRLTYARPDGLNG